MGKHSSRMVGNLTLGTSQLPVIGPEHCRET